MPKTLDLPTTHLPSVKRALAAVGATVSDVHATPGACGYVRVTVHPAPRPRLTAAATARKEA